jgi:hypothetical protein
MGDVHPIDRGVLPGEIQQLIDKKFVEEADMEYDGHHTYVPNHPVFRRDKNTSKIRPVFHGAAKSKFGLSLNEVLEIGPNLNPDLLSVTMRFRMTKIAWIADIGKSVFEYSATARRCKSDQVFMVYGAK